ncbi:MAG TPA: helix-turn-helix transcriptional regulator [Vicinamibacterales bacterium]|nr:helix-turn-helix transcriptional regulator [Vicinamibacterales bacterium]
MPFGTLLRHWRTSRGLSQLALATDAGISTRHLSFLETGRAHPSREMVILLAGMLRVPETDRNAFLVSAGYAPLLIEDSAQPPMQLAHVQRALEFILRQQEPYPAIAVDPHSTIVMMNQGARRTFGQFYQPEQACKPVNATRTIFDPHGLRPYVQNWDHHARRILQSLQHDVAFTGDASLMQLRDELLEYPGVPKHWLQADPTPEPLLANLTLAKGDLSLSFFSTVTTLATPRDTALHQIRIKCFFPADAATEQFVREVLPAA